MKKMLALVLAALMMVSTAAVALIQTGAEVDVPTTETANVEETTEPTEDTTEADTGAETEEETTAAPVVTPEKMDPTCLKNFVTTNNFAVVGPHTAGQINDEGGYIELRPDLNSDTWKSDTEGTVVDAFAQLDVAWYLRQNASSYTANKLALTKDLMYIVIKAKQGDNFMEEPSLQCWFGVPLDPKKPREISEFPLYSDMVIEGDDGFAYLVFGVADSGYTEEWIGHTLSTLKFTWASCEVNDTTRNNAFMDVYEICFLGTAEDVDAYVGTEIEWPEVDAETTTKAPDKKPAETTAAATEAATTTATTEPAAGCKSVIASVSVLSAIALAAGVVVCKKKD